jgi:hypothetical protein
MTSEAPKSAPLEDNRSREEVDEDEALDRWAHEQTEEGYRRMLAERARLQALGILDEKGDLTPGPLPPEMREDDDCDDR